MTSIDSTSALVAIIRQQVAGARTSVQSGKNTPAGATSASARKGARSLSELVAQRIGAIGADDPQRNRKAFRAFLESVLLGELGMNLINDPAFYHIVDTVQTTMEGDPDLASRIDEAGQLLLAAPR